MFSATLLLYRRAILNSIVVLILLIAVILALLWAFVEDERDPGYIINVSTGKVAEHDYSEAIPPGWEPYA